jgi:hypothetical protein
MKKVTEILDVFKQLDMKRHHGWDSPTLKLCYICPWLALFQLKTLLKEKSVIAELGESQPWSLSLPLKQIFATLRQFVWVSKLQNLAMKKHIFCHLHPQTWILQIGQFKWEGQGRVSHLFWKYSIWTLVNYLYYIKLTPQIKSMCTIKQTK